MISFRAIPFSFALFWRYLLAFPVVLIVAILFGLVVGIVVAICSLALPMFFVTVLSVVAAFAMSVMPIIVCLRIGLVTKGVKPGCTYGKLFGPILAYGIAFGIVTALIFGAAAGFYYWQSGLTMADFLALQDQSQHGRAQHGIVMSKIIDTIPLAIGAFGGALAVFFCFVASMMVPMASASVARDFTGERHMPLSGFGTGFAPVAVLLILAYAITFLAPAILALLFGFAGHEDFIQSAFQIEAQLATGQLAAGWWINYAIVLALTFLIGIYAQCLYCAGAVLAYTDRVDDDDPEQPTFSAAQAQPLREDARDLWKSRMQDL